MNTLDNGACPDLEDAHYRAFTQRKSTYAKKHLLKGVIFSRAYGTCTRQGGGSSYNMGWASRLKSGWQLGIRLVIIVLSISDSLRIESSDLHNISSDFAGYFSHCCHHYLLDQGSSLLQQPLVKI